MRSYRKALGVLVVIALLVFPATPGFSAATETEVTDICEALFGDTFGVPNGEPLADCQWDMALIDAGHASYANATGKGAKVGVLDTGVDMTHPDIASNLDVDLSCSFIFDDTPTADPAEIANGDCSIKSAVQDLSGHGTHVASIIAAPVNGVGIAGVAPEATIVALKVCTEVGFCFADSVAAALRYAGDVGLDVVNMSLFADPFLYYCKDDADQRAILRELEAAARYAQQRGVLIVAAAGNQSDDLQHPDVDTISPVWPPGEAEEREVGNQCWVAPAELPGVLTVSATGPIGIAGYDAWISDFSSVGVSVVNVTAPGGDYFQATGTVQDAVLGALSSTGDETNSIWEILDFLETNVPGLTGLTVLSDGARYGFLNGTSMAAPHAAGVAALIVEKHPRWNQSAVKAAVQRTTTDLSCPSFEYAHMPPCEGGHGHNSYFGHGLVNALNASRS